MTLIPDNDAIKVKEICKKIMQRLSQTYTISDNHVTAQFIISVSRYPNDASHPTQLLSNTISLLDHTKRMAGDIVFYDEETLKKEQFRFLLKEAMSQADMDQEFTLVYQPKIRLADESCVGAEALLRWKNKDLGVIPPDIFIPVAEETGYIKKITRWVISRALKDIEQLCSKTGKDKEKFNIAINLSVMDINDPDFITFIEAQTKMSKVSMSCIEFELTERIQMDQDPQIQQTLSRLNEMGFRIAIDDFGTGYSSLSYLHQMNANNLKIDKSFITKIENSAHVNSYPVVDAVISMGSSMGLEVTAEGVETKEQAIYLSKQGCDTAQGWFYAKAVSMEDFIKYVSQ